MPAGKRFTSIRKRNCFVNGSVFDPYFDWNTFFSLDASLYLTELMFCNAKQYKDKV